MVTRVQRIRERMISEYGRSCMYCGAEDLNGRALYMDYLVPVSQGGTDDMQNRVPCCGTCFKRKAGRDIYVYSAERHAAWQKERNLLECLTDATRYSEAESRYADDIPEQPSLLPEGTHTQDPEASLLPEGTHTQSIIAEIWDEDD